MRLKVLAFLAAACSAAVFAGPASATIHPLTVGWVCGEASGDPPGQTPGEQHSPNSTFRALQATGLLVGVDPTTGMPIFDLTLPEAKFSDFVVMVTSSGTVVESGTPSNPGALDCANAEFITG
jgi:hypothetical protein